jgi:hypothetical protein
MSASASAFNTVEEIIDAVKSLETNDLFKMSKAVTAEIERRAKSKGGKAAAPKKTGSMPKGQVPPQLRKPRAWVGYVLKDAQENGWTSYTVHQARKNKETGEKEEEEIEMPGSEQNEDGQHVFEGSINEKTPKGKAFIHKDAMSLSKHYYTAKTKTGSRPDLYEAFEAAYVDDDDTASQASTSSDKVVVRITAADKEAEKERKVKEKEAEKERKVKEKEAEKERKAAEKEAEKERKAAEKAAAKGKEAKSTVVKAADVKVAKAAEPVPIATPPPKAKATPAAPKKKKEEWTCPNDDMVHEFVYEGKTYLRNFNGQIWEENDGELGAWAGVWDGKKIDTDAPEPQFE